ncbi:GNAT family N-acetyltransferase [Hyalangium rubrum]|uniref:GNAT family N-acetyltransferase n=1 Tax=Hyalangium rubrum TaxID=3103134 RepID=A0ABU5H0I9_9BACT|nr:GNAT family N-acetyltransferase [Hyalangium sp. s54d21]MDY7226968.1 GNAT family N-acetyltransferase [Hyalangium sp. s54d21]
MTEIQIRTLRGEDFESLRQLEADIFGSAGYAVVSPHYLRLCTDFFADTCFLALVDGQPIGYMLCFVRGREAYSTRLGVCEEFHGTGVAMRLIGACISKLVEDDYDLLWFTVKPDNTHARELYRRLGAVERAVRRDFLAPGDELIIGEVDKQTLIRLGQRFRPSREVARPSGGAGLHA